MNPPGEVTSRGSEGQLVYWKSTGRDIHEEIVMSDLLALVMSFSLGANAAKVIEITYWTHTDDNRTAIETKYIAEFEKMY